MSLEAAVQSRKNIKIKVQILVKDNDNFADYLQRKIWIKKFTYNSFLIKHLNSVSEVKKSQKVKLTICLHIPCLFQMNLNHEIQYKIVTKLHPIRK